MLLPNQTMVDSLKPTETIPQYRLIHKSTGKLYQLTDTTPPDGVSLERGSSTGSAIAYQFAGIVPIEIDTNASITTGSIVEATTDGKIREYTTGIPIGETVSTITGNYVLVNLDIDASRKIGVKYELMDVIKLNTYQKNGMLQWSWSPDSDKFLNTNWSNVYQYYLCEILEVDSNTVFARHAPQRFATDTALFNYINDNCSKTSGSFDYSVVVKCWDIVDSSIPTITKIYGQNYVLATCKGHKSYFKKAPKGGCNIDSDVRAQSFLQATFKALGIPRAVPNPPTEDDRRMINYTANKTRFYGPISLNQSVWDGVKRAIMMYDTTTSSFTTFTSGSYQIDINNPKVIYTLSRGSGLADYNYADMDATGLRVFMRHNYSKVLAYKLSRSSGRYVGALIKPVGIDQFNVNAFDNSRYQLEAHITRDNNKKLYTVATQTGTQTSDIAGDCASIFTIKDILASIGTTEEPSYGSWTTQYNKITFALRDKQTGARSEISRVYIYGKKGQRIYPFAWNVRAD